jgi:hypothetical protein
MGKRRIHCLNLPQLTLPGDTSHESSGSAPRSKSQTGFTLSIIGDWFTDQLHQCPGGRICRPLQLSPPFAVLIFVPNFPCTEWSAVRDQIGFWNFFVQSRKNASVRTRKLYQVAVRRLLWALNPGWKMRNVVIIHDRCELCGFDFFQSKQGARLRNGESVSPGLQESEKS